MPKTEADFIPKAVQDQADKATAAQKAAQAGKEPGPTNPVEPVKPEPTNPTPVIEPAPVVTPVEPAPGTNDFEHKFNVLQGMYNKDINEMRTALDDGKTMMANQQKIIDQLNATPVAAPAPAATVPAPAPIAVLNKEDFNSYGVEMEDLIKTVNDIAHRIATLEKRPAASPASNDSGMVDRVKRIEANQTRSLKDRFYDDMDRMLPDWGAKNQDPKFKAWLDTIDDVSQIQRGIMLKHALSNWNAIQVVAIFTSYFGGSAIAPGASTGDPANPLAGQVVPNTTGNADGGDGGQPPPKYATKAELLKAQDDFVHQRIEEKDYDKVAASFQAGIKAGVNTQQT